MGEHLSRLGSYYAGRKNTVLHAMYEAGYHLQMHPKLADGLKRSPIPNKRAR